EQRLEEHVQLFSEDRSAFERGPTHQAYEIGALLEEGERRTQHPLNLGPTLAFATLGFFDERVPTDERLEQHRAIERFLRREVMQQARTADPDLVGDLVEARSRVAVVGEAPGGDLKNVILGR